MSDLDQLRQDLAAVAFVPGTDTVADHEATLRRARRLLEVKLGFEAGRGSAAPPVVVLAGGTNVGKSTVFNWLVGEAVASSSPLARHTKAPTVLAHSGEITALRDGPSFMPGYRHLNLSTPADAAGEAVAGQVAIFLRSHTLEAVRGVILVDSPDIDSTMEKNHEVAEDLLFLADEVVFVSTPEKYNDELCVRYLRRAARLMKSIVAVLNKGADEEVARDFSQVVVPSLRADVPVLLLPYVPRPEPAQADGWREELRRAVIPAREEAATARQLALRGACVELGQDVERVVSRLREELSELDRVRAEVDLVLAAQRDVYVRFLEGLEFYELDRVLERVMRYFRIPVLDAVYDGVRGAFSFIGAQVGRLAGRQERDTARERTEARTEQDRQKVKELLETARAEVLEVPAVHGGTLHAAIPGWLSGLQGVSVAEINQAVQEFHRLADAQAEAWIERETRRQVELLEAHPYARNALRAIKGSLQIGTGLASAYLTAGLGPWDLLIGTATERAIKVLLESAGGHVHYQNLKRDFTQGRAAVFMESLEQAVGRPLKERLPSGADPDRLDRLARAAAVLRRGEMP